MAQQNYKIIDTNYDLNNYELVIKELKNYEFYKQNLTTHRTCTKHKTKNEFRVVAADTRKFALSFDNEKNAIDILNSDSNVDLGGVLETDLQEEIEKITPENIEEKSKEFLERFNKNFKLHVTYNPTEEDIDMIDERAKKTVWNTENRFLLNFYMMEVTKRRFNFPDWSFRKVYTFNPFNEVLYIGRDGFENTYYNWLEPKKKKYFDFRLYLGLVLPQDAPSLKRANK